MRTFLLAPESARTIAACVVVLSLCTVGLAPRPFHEIFTLPDVERAEGATAGIVAHRGLNRYAPENTYAAAELCVALGFAYVEVDVRTTRDGVLVIIHDETVDRTTDGTGRVDEMLWDELRRLDAGSWFGPAFAGQRAPRVDEFVAWAKGRIGIYFDIKDADAAALLSIVNEHGVRDEVFFWARDRDFARELRSLDASIAIKVNPRSDEEIASLRSELGAAICEFDRKTFSPERVTLARVLGMRPMLYTNRDEPELFAQALAAGVELFNIDYVESFVRVERETHYDH